MEVILFLLIVGITLVIAKSFLGIRSRLLLVESDTPIDPNSLTHDGITTLLSKMGHPEFRGVCYGFTLNWALNVADGHETLFYKQLHLLRVHQVTLPTIMQQIRIKRKESKSLTGDEHTIETLPKLLRKICMAQSPLQYKTYYGKLVWQSDVPTILSKIASKYSNVKRIFYKTHTFASMGDANNYFDLLKSIGINGRTAVIISTDDHAMGFKLAGHLWRFIDINGLFKQHVEKPYYEFTSKQLAHKLYKLCSNGTLITRLTVNTDFIALQSHDSLSRTLSNMYPRFPLKSKMTYAEKIAFFTMAALQGDLETVKQCLKAGLSIFFHDQLSDDSPLLTALFEGRREVVQAMISSPRFLINKRRKSDGFTLLHLACESGGADIVGDLLKIRRILVDAQDKKGRTPLMVACEKTTFTRDKKLFEQLLAHGASRTIKDQSGLTALDHAIQNDHYVAIRMIRDKKLSKTIPASRAITKTGKIASNKATFFNKTFKTTSSNEVSPCMESTMMC
ncbi:Dot/Icm T4SS effector AnkG/AnkZ/LegA7 [Legionella fallonii]|uniref:Uncharacterized protein n=1 Tax=Legionella fallonii LLAP-10 TaxID=1212491 RepID=A0A098G7U3_9GAMM|nr:Dot/Icm T4SS effector AnkG/AnkZ/LegA7 [Legionella fallonii]CEG58081.1 conserved protein of unknown function [ankyrin repeat] [Legionella fallonii LLAP-10]